MQKYRALQNSREINSVQDRIISTKYLYCGQNAVLIVFFSFSLSIFKLIELPFSHQYEMLETVSEGNIYGVNRLKL